MYFIMPVDPQLQQLLNMINQFPMPPFETISPSDYRGMEKMMTLPFATNKTELFEVKDQTIPLKDRDIAIRIYRPTAEQGPRPALVFYHGGGWVVGSLDSHDELCRQLAHESSCTVISIDYRLAPEYKFPTAVWDAYDALVYLTEHAAEFEIDPMQIAVGGDSAGGNLATVACIIANQKGGVPAIQYQLLYYPSVGNEKETDSYRENQTGYLLTAEMMEWFRKHYFNTDEESQHVYAAPLLYEDLSGLPPAMIITAEYDPLRDGGAAYAKKLQEQGVAVEYMCYEGMIHGFMSMPQIDKAKAGVLQGAEALKRIFNL